MRGVGSWTASTIGQTARTKEKRGKQQALRIVGNRAKASHIPRMEAQRPEKCSTSKKERPQKLRASQWINWAVEKKRKKAEPWPRKQSKSGPKISKKWMGVMSAYRTRGASLKAQ